MTQPRSVTAVFALLFIGLGAYAVHALVGIRGSEDVLFETWLYNGLLLVAGALCLARAAGLRATRRAAWLLLGTGMIFSSLAEIYWSAAIDGLDPEPYPTVADALWLAYYPPAYLALALLLRDQARGLKSGLWLDGATGALAIGAVGSALLAGPLAAATEGDPMAVAVNLAYPLGDLLLLGLVVFAFGLNGWRPGRMWLYLGAGLAVTAISDSVYLYQIARETYESSLLDALWPLGALLLAWAAWRAPKRTPVVMEGARVLAAPIAFAVTALGVLLYGNTYELSDLAQALATAALLTAIVRTAMLFAAHARAHEHSRREAGTDALTGLNNRRQLMTDLEEMFDAVEGPPRAGVLVLLDLDGFKHYNDTFGHPAGDALLARLGRRLGDAVAPSGTAYRLGGDEFCVIHCDGGERPEVVTTEALGALADSSAGFQITASNGTVLIPQEASSAADAMQLADQRLYAEKGARPSAPRHQAAQALLSAVREREPELDEHGNDVAVLAARVGRRIGLPSEELDVLVRAAELHDVGKLAIPETILRKPGPLTEEDWAFMQRHTLIGQRILGAAAALRPVGDVVRATHERYDGAGYPDGLAGERIPLAARVINVCDAYDAVVTGRPYRNARSHGEAIEELRAHSGSQFDPEVVHAFVSEFEATGPPVARSSVRALPSP